MIIYAKGDITKFDVDAIYNLFLAMHREMFF